MIASLPATHPSLGVPSKVYPYRNESGDIVAAVYRFEPVNTGITENQQYSPEERSITDNLPHQLDRFLPVNAGETDKNRCLLLPFCVQTGHWSRPEKPILYDLEAIAADRSSPVIVVESENCADALSRFGFLSTTNMGGFNAAQYSDWTSLEGRNVIIWPDHYETEASSSRKVAGLCWKAGAVSVAIIDLEQDALEKAVTTGNGQCPEAVSIGGHQVSPKAADMPTTNINGLPQGWNAEEAVEEGWARPNFEKLIEEAKSTKHRSPPVAANDNWPEPDLSILDRDTPPPVFPMEIFPPALADWIMKAAKSKSAPVDYVAASVLTGAASLIGSARRISLWEGWSEPAILWSAIVGNPSAGKSPAMDPVLSALSAIEGDSLPEFEEAIRYYETQKMEADLVRSSWERKAKEAVELSGSPPLLPEGAQTPAMPVRKRLTIRDATSEALLAALKGQPKGLLMTRDELAGWFASFDRYSGSKGGDRALWLEAFGGRSYVVDRVKNGGEAIHIPSLGISVIGGMQPDKLESCLLKGDDDGLSSRFLYFCPRPAQRQRPMHSADQRLFERWMRKLDALAHDVDENGKPLPRHIPLSGEGIEVFHTWWQGLLERDTDNARMNGWWGKSQGTASRLALVLEYLAWAASPDAMEPLEVQAETMEKAIGFMDHYAGPMAEIAHGAASRSEADANTLKLARYILEQGFQEFSVRNLQRSGPSPIRSLKAPGIKTTCCNLVDAGWLQASPVRQGDTSGRCKDRFLVNPALS